MRPLLGALPLRIRLTVMFALVMGAMLAVTGAISISRFVATHRKFPPSDPRQGLAQHAAIAELRTELMVALPLVLLVATTGAYLLTAAALRPVERLRAQAAAVTGTASGARLQVPPGRDEIARLARTLNDMLARLQSALERERRFTADAGHELRTPLSLLQTELELATRRPRPPEELTAALRSAHEETQRLVRLTEDLLLLARVDTGPADDVEVAPVLNGVAARPPGTPGATTITVRCPAGLTARTGADLLHRAVTNLVDNALRHGGSPVAVTATEHSGHLEIRVRDHGPGFPPGFLPHAFERFTRADGARTGAGTGLGLAITAAIARSSGGGHGAANHPDGGAEVWITLPR